MGHKILLADDSITIQKVIELTFSDEDFELHTVGNGQKAIDEIGSIQPDIVLCDIIMPEKNGYEVCEFIKTSDDLKHVPVLLLTGAFEPFDQERAKAAGCDGFLAKPFEPQTLISKVKELLARSANSQPAQPAPQASPAQSIPAAAQPAPPQPAEDQDTIFVAPPSLSDSPPPTPRPSAPPAPSSPSSYDGGGLDESFAVEAGERELSMGPDDQTALLGPNESSSSSAPPSSSASDDIWGEVAAPPPEPDDDSATVFMAASPLEPLEDAPSPPETSGLGETNDPDTTWQMPPSEPEPSPTTQANEPVAAEELGGFEEFASAGPEASSSEGNDTLAPPLPAREQTPAPAQAPPSPSGSEPFSPLESMDMAPEEIESPRVESVSESLPPPPPLPPRPPEAASSPGGRAENGAFAPMTPARPIEPATPPPAPEQEMVFEAPEPEPSHEGAFEIESDRESEFVPASTPPVKEEPVPRAPASASTAASKGADGADEDLVERVAQRVVDKLSEKVIQEIAWEVVPDLAEGLIRREIDALKAKIPK